MNIENNPEVKPINLNKSGASKLDSVIVNSFIIVICGLSIWFGVGYLLTGYVWRGLCILSLGYFGFKAGCDNTQKQ